MLECLAKPGKRAVHKLRTSTRRIEAQLELLSMLPELPAHDKPRQKVHRLLKKLRQAAGDVRDLDVQRDLVAESAPRKRGPQYSDEVRKEGRQLRQELKRQRGKHADELAAVLKQEKADLPLAFKGLFDSLEAAESLAISEADLTSMVRTWYGQHSPAVTPDPNQVEQLHDIRKQAKLARYLAESAPASAAKARRMAAEFEDLQEAGGEWHDWVLLAEVARTELGDSAKLPQLFASRAEKSLKLFGRRIEKMNSHNGKPHARAA